MLARLILARTRCHASVSRMQHGGGWRRAHHFTLCLTLACRIALCVMLAPRTRRTRVPLSAGAAHPSAIAPCLP